MRADRLVAVYLLLQRRGQVTAAEVAAELEVSERTARRDLDALGVAGFPVYSTRGRGGGWRLAGGGRTDLSGLTGPEVRALFLLAGPEAGRPAVRAAVRKLVAALPSELRDTAEAAAAAVVVDPDGWGGRPRTATPDPALLADVQRAVVERQELRLGYRSARGDGTSRTVQPLGLAMKNGAWYLVAGTAAGRRTFRVDRVTAAEPTGRSAERPHGFDLAGVWREITDDVVRLRDPVVATGFLDPALVGAATWVFADRISLGSPGADGRIPVELRGPSVRGLAGQVAGFGAGLEVSAPAGLRDLLAAVGTELVGTYAGGAAGGQDAGSPGTP